MKTCYKCGSQMPDDAQICTRCGSPLAAGNDSGTNTMAVVALVFGLGGLLLTLAAPILPGISSAVGVVMCIVGIIFGVRARNATPVGYPGRGMATAGFACAIIGTVIGTIATCIACVCTCAVCAVAGASASDFSGFFSGFFDFFEIILMW